MRSIDFSIFRKSVERSLLIEAKVDEFEAVQNIPSSLRYRVTVFGGIKTTNKGMRHEIYGDCEPCFHVLQAILGCI